MLRWVRIGWNCPKCHLLLGWFRVMLASRSRRMRQFLLFLSLLLWGCGGLPAHESREEKAIRGGRKLKQSQRHE
jgi:hypothetical protein